MAPIDASVVWDGPQRGTVMVIAEPAATNWGAVPLDDQITMLRQLDDSEEATGPIVGIEIEGFLQFKRWADVPESPELWEVPGLGPLPLVELLRREQQRLREQAEAA